ncbi:YqaJ viral recombinase family protein [Clostridium thailandense]|uniref:YqaJ viral recombinase family nuclease n=1 Tax=Clostridium thailandense TaxID=2794346 RepID=UPI003989373E
MSNILVKTNNLTKGEWYKWRNKGIGGSDVAAICGLNKYKSPVQLWMEKTEQIAAEEAGEAAYFGTILEPIIKMEFTKRTSLPIRNVKAILKHPIYSFMLANLDGVVKDPIHDKCIFEAKTASAFKQEQWENGIPEEYMLQVQHYMAVTGYQKAYVAVLIGGNHFKYKVIDKDEEIIQMIIKLEENFWNHVLNNTPPPLDGSQASSELLSRLYPSSKNTSELLLPDEAFNLICSYELAKEHEKQASEMKDEAANKLKSMLGSNEKGIIKDKIVSWKSIFSERVDTKKLQIEMPDIYNKYLSKSNSRRFSIKLY